VPLGLNQNSAVTSPNLEQESSRASPQRVVLLLQGLMGRLFRRLGQELIRSGHRVYKVNFNGGDRLFWRLPGGIDYRGSLDEWPSVLRDIIREKGITDVVLFGDCRSYHLAATQICREAGLPVHVFEEGYIRPDWVTLELGGVNGHSTLPSDANFYRKTAASLPARSPHKQVPSSFRRRAAEGLAYNVADILSRWYYPHWHNHRPWHPLVEGYGWARKLLRGRGKRTRATALIEHLERTEAEYFLFPLQLPSDAQIRLHSDFESMDEALETVIGSFARHAPAHTRLVIKEHPLDNGVCNWRRQSHEIAARFGVEDRVDYLGWGDIVPVAARAKGMVTINSTSGTLALASGVPVVVLGQAVYDIEDVTHQDGLDAFWCNPARPDAETFSAFQRVLVERCLIPGGFFSEEALDKVVQHAVRRFEDRKVLQWLDEHAEAQGQG